MATRRTGLWLLTIFFFFLLLFTVFVWGLNRVLVGPASGVGRGTVLVIRLQGAIGEIAQRGPFVGAVTVREIDEALRRAATDSRVAAVFLEVGPIGGGYGYRPAAYGGPLVGSIPDALGITGASSSDIGVGLGFYTGSRYEGY